MKPGAGKLFLLFAGFIALCGLVCADLFKLQILDHDYYSHRADRNQKAVKEIPARRGTIYDRNLVPLAMTLPCYRVWADPGLVGDRWQTATRLAEVLDVECGRIARMLADASIRYRVLKRYLDPPRAETVAALGLEGIICEPVAKRVRPLGDVAANVIGAVSLDGCALSGIERAEDAILRGKPGKKVFLRNALGEIRPSVGSLLQEPSPGRSLVLTLDAELQYISERALEDAIVANHAKRGGVVIVDPWTGEVLALASWPRHPNFPVQVVFEPGSALKICTYGAALETNNLKLDEVFTTNNGVLKVSGGYIRDDHPRDPITAVEAFAYSSNVVAALLARRLGAETFYRYLVAFGLGRRTGIELEGEPHGLLRPPDAWSKRSLETIAFGQEIGVTAIQLCMAFAAVANGGKLMRPTLIKAVLDHGKVVHTSKPRVVRRVIREQTARKLTELLKTVVSEGTGVAARIDGMAIAGKTGTGQKAEAGGYVRGKGYAVFSGFVPADAPRYVCTVVIEDPSGETSYGGPVCGPVFKEIMECALRGERKVVPSTSIELAELPLDGSYEASAGAVAGFDLASSLTPGRQQTYPSVLGLTLREAAMVLKQCGIKWRATGSGLVVRQDPSPGKPIVQRRICSLVMEAIR